MLYLLNCGEFVISATQELSNAIMYMYLFTYLSKTRTSDSAPVQSLKGFVGLVVMVLETAVERSHNLVCMLSLDRSLIC